MRYRSAHRLALAPPTHRCDLLREEHQPHRALSAAFLERCRTALGSPNRLAMAQAAGARRHSTAGRQLRAHETFMWTSNIMIRC